MIRHDSLHGKLLCMRYSLISRDTVVACDDTAYPVLVGLIYHAAIYAIAVLHPVWYLIVALCSGFFKPHQEDIG